jgi:(heptosyl)LPS beta-1,4-glucosyltransferase
MTGSSRGGWLSLSALVISLDEERNLADCLSSLAFADEIVVVARRMGAIVHTNPWPGYGPQKNFGMDRASGDWILIVDADDPPRQGHGGSGGE